MKKLAIIGCGGIGGYHLNRVSTFKDIELAGFCDIIPKKAEDFVARAGTGKAFKNFKEMYDEVNPDMVFICVPPTEHGEIEFETINRRIPFFVEKPITLSMDLANEICQKVKEANLITAVGFQGRYSSLVEHVAKFIKEKRIVFISLIGAGGVPKAEWWKKRATSGGQIVEQAIHRFDTLRYLFDEPDEVFTMGARGFVDDIEGYDTEDVSTTVVRFKNGAIATLSTGCYAKTKDALDGHFVFSSRDARLEWKTGKVAELKIFGYGDEDIDKESNGSNKGQDLVIKGDGIFTGPQSKGIIYKQEGDHGTICDRTFVDAVITGDGSKIRSPYEDALRTLEFTLACNKSMDTGLPVKIG